MNNKSWILVFLTPWIFQVVESYVRNDLAPAGRQGCVWSTENNSNDTKGSQPVIPTNLRSLHYFSLQCNLRTLSIDFWNYTFNRDQIQQTEKVKIECSDRLFFESFLHPGQSLFRLVNVKQIQIDSCKIRRLPTRIFGNLGFLKRLELRSYNGEWSSAVSLEIETGSFEGLSQLQDLDLSSNNIWSLPNKNVFCPLKSLVKLNISRNRLSDLEEFSGGNVYCALNFQNVDLSFNTLRRVGNNVFSSRMRKVTELRLQNNLLEELEDYAFAGLEELKLLDLSSNRLVALPPSIFRSNPALRELNLSNNSISALSSQVFFGLETLLSLDLSRNTLTSQWIKENMFASLKRLIILRMSGNQLSQIDGMVFKNLRNLQALYLDSNRIETINPQAFVSLNNLHVLDLSRNRLSHIDSRAFSSLNTVRQLYLDHNKIRSMDESALKNLTKLQDLGLADNELQEVPVALRGLSQLLTLDIGENKITVVNNDSFTGLEQVMGLRLVDNRLTELPREFCAPLKKLRVLNVAQNRIRKISGNAFSSCPELRALRLDTNNIEELPASLAPQLPALLWLNVSQNRLTWADYHLLPPTIEWLDVSHNQLESLGGPVNSEERTQSSSGQSSFSLRVLDASHNHLTTLDYTTVPPSLETLRVNYNKLKSVASDTFIRATRLRRVELMGNQLETLPLSAIRFPPIPLDKPLPELYLGGNNFSCTCSMEWLSRVSQLSILRTHPRIIDLDSITCRPTFSRPNQLVPLVETRPKDFLCQYTSHCFALCHCCDFDACDCQMTCPEGCNCFHDNSWSTNIVECSNSNFSLVPTRLPMDSSEIYLDGNNLTQLDSHVFIGKKNLRVLFLNDSKVELIRNKTFNGLRALEILHLEDNFLTELHGFELGDAENLRELYLQNNLLTFIAKETFTNLKFLELLRLDGNLLIDFNVWELSGNGYLNSVMLANNPWSCDCEFLIPFRTWVASKNSIVVDFSTANCQTVNSTHLVAGSSSSGETAPDHHHYQLKNMRDTKMEGGKKLYPIQIQHPISSMCNHNSELNFNFNPIQMESEILSNHISAMSGGAEKVTIPHPIEHEIQFERVDSSSSESTFWSLVLSLTALIVLVAVIVGIFRKEIYYWIYTHVCSNNRTGGAGELRRGNRFSPFLLCCGEKGGGKVRKYGDDSDKLFDAYFIYGKKDEEILLQKIVPELESQGPAYFRLCLHHRDLCLSADNPWNSDMILSACDASKTLVLVLSRIFLQTELSHSHFRQAIQSAINRHQKKLILILLPPFTEQNLSTIYPDFKNSQVKSSVLDWTDKNFWSKLKLVLPTPTNFSNSANSTIPRNSRRGSSLLISSTASPGPLIDLQAGMGMGTMGSSNNSSNASGTMSSYTINRLNFPYGSQHQYLPYQISSTINPSSTSNNHHHPIPFPHHFLHGANHQQQPQQYPHNYNLYNASQYSSASQPHSHYFMGNNNFLPGEIPHHQITGSLVYPAATLPHPRHPQPPPHLLPAFNESFRRHLQHQQQQQQSKSVVGMNSGGPGSIQFAKQTGYQPLEPNYSSSAISSAEEMEHVYSTLDLESPLQSPGPNNNNTSCCAKNKNNLGPSENKGGGSESANKLLRTATGNGNRIEGNGNVHHHHPHLPLSPSSPPEGQRHQGPSTNNSNNNNGQMYFV